nr:DUF927 domain-containing protein [Lactiplantibacillus plantarum]
MNNQVHQEFRAQKGLPKGYYVTGTSIYQMTKKGAQYICPILKIIKRYKDYQTKDETYVLEYWEQSTGDMELLRVDSDIFSTRGVDLLSKKGVVFPTGNKNKITTYLARQKSLIQITTLFSNVGWQQANDDISAMVFNEGDSEVNPEKDSFLAATKIPEIPNGNSRNDGSKYNLKPTGSYDVWMTMFREQVSGCVPLQFAVLFGLAAVLVPILRQWNQDLHNLLCHVAGQSSTGKTTMADLAVSVAGRPNTDRNGLIRTWSTTQNALTITLNGNNGIPIVFDELSMVPFKDLTSMVYQIADGSEKSRATQSAGLKEQRLWSTAILSTGELKLTDKINGNDGLLVRLLEISDVQFTKNAQQSEIIKNVVSHNYGHVLPKFVQGLQSKSRDELRKRYSISIEQVEKQLPESRFKSRLAKKIAVFPMTADLANEFFHWGLNAKDIIQFLVKNTNNSWMIPVGKRALEKVIEYLVIHQKELKLGNNNFYVPANLLGSIKLVNDNIEINVIKSQLLTILSELRFQDTSTILNEWKNNGTLCADKDRKTHRIMVAGNRMVTYKLKIGSEYLSQFYALKENSSEQGDLLADMEGKEQHGEK